MVYLYPSICGTEVYSTTSKWLIFVSCEFTLNNWYHIASTWHPNNGAKMYFNGQLIVSDATGSSQSVANNDQNVYLGRTQASSQDVDGYYDDVAIWETEKDAAFILAWYNSY